MDGNSPNENIGKIMFNNILRSNNKKRLHSIFQKFQTSWLIFENSFELLKMKVTFYIHIKL